ncbi:MAG: dienelactone hydrolase family protein [Gammaproteobacteria bacterium]|jgi:phospholipase/carboxylesterase
MLPFEIINPKTTAQFAVIWLHGLGADGYDFMPVVPELKLDDKPIRFIFPHAPIMPVTINHGMQMPAWFDLHEISPAAKHDIAGIEKAYQQISELIEDQHQQGIAYEHIALVGFSQGGALALYTGLRFKQPLAGIMGLSTYLPLIQSLKEAISAPTDLPIFLAHGTQDPIVPIEAGFMTEELLSSQGYTVEWHTYEMAHQVCMHELTDIGAWLSKIFKESA